MRINYIMTVLFIALIGALSSCKRGRPVRKTLPDYLSYNGSFESQNPAKNLDELSIYLSDTVLYTSGARQKMFNIAIPDPGTDSVAWNIIQAFEPLESSVATLMQSLNKTGVVVDFRLTENSNPNRQDFSVELTQTKDKPQYHVVFLWDDKSRARAEQFLLKAVTEPGIRCVSAPQAKNGLFDCFEKPKTSFQ